MNETALPADAKIMLVAIEPSADALGAALLRELRKTAPENAQYLGCGGPLMAAAGFDSAFPIERLSVMGFTDVIRALPEAWRRSEDLARIAEADGVGVVVFIDGWGFSRLCAPKMRKAAPGAKIFKFAAPQVWASRPNRVGFVRRHFDGVLCLLPFEPHYFEEAGTPAAFVGNPNFQAAWAARGDGRRFRARHGLGAAPLLAVLPGSRTTEIERHLKTFGEAVRHLTARLEGLRIVTVLPPSSVADRARAEMERWPGAPIVAAPDEKADAFAAADAAIAKSGTVTTELAINNTPMIVGYRVDPLTAFWARRVVTAPFATILNIAAGREVIPELLQEDCRGELLAGGALRLLTDAEARLEQLEAFPPLLARLGIDGAPAAQLAAAKIAEWAGWRGAGGGER